jgi:hypothetical protein
MKTWSVQVQVTHRISVRVQAENDLRAGDVAEDAVSGLIGDLDVGTWPDGTRAVLELHAVEAIDADVEEG